MIIITLDRWKGGKIKRFQFPRKWSIVRRVRRGRQIDMCNLYRLSSTHAEVARLFNVDQGPPTNVGTEVYPGYPGLVIEGGTLRSMVWGFPLVLKSKKTGKPLKPKPVNNARADKLDSFMWRYSFDERRCLIPLTAWAEAEGKPGSKTRTWLSLPDAETFTVAGIWRDSDEWGPCYSMIMVDADGPAADVHNRMPVLLAEKDREQWSDGSTEEARQLCRAWSGSLDIDRTDRPWRA